MKIIKISIILMVAFAANCSAQSLKFTNNGTWANIGDIDIQGNQITVEALVFMTSPNTFGGNIISKHTNPQNVNYLLRPYSFELTTYISGNSGPTKFSLMKNPFTISQNTWHHIAGTYNGASVKYYVDGCLVIEQPFSGNLFQNNFLTAIGNQSNCQCEPFFGNIDEVRIWNVCRTQDEIRNNMLDLPNPNLQTGLVAYYKMENSLVNNQGNSIWNGTFIGIEQYSNDRANIEPFEVANLSISNADCEGVNNGSIVVTTNRTNSEYALNGTTFQTSDTFSNLGNGAINLFARSSEGCVIDSVVFIGNNKLYNLVNEVKIICQGENYFGYSTSGIYIDTLDANIGCDTIRTINLKVQPNATSSINKSICQGEIYEGYSTSGTFIDVFTAANGCDSTRTLILTVLPSPTTNQSISICDGDVYEGYATSGTFVDIFTTANGCDSTRTLILTILPNPITNQSISICDGEIYEGYATSGTFTDVFTTANGCDSTRTLNLKVLPNLITSLSISICKGEVYEGYTKSGTYTNIFKATNGCDSTRTLNLKIHDTYEKNETITICKGSSYNFNGKNISTAGMYTDTLYSIFGCDSIFNLEVRVSTNDFLGNDTVLCGKDEYILKSPSDNTRWFDNDISQSKRVSSTGLYWALILDANGCEITDSVYVQFNIKSFVPKVFSPNDDGINDCFTPFFSAIDEIVKYRFSVFDRWGNHVFATTSKDDCWNGRNREKECSSGIYVYFVEISTKHCGGTMLKGDLTLIK